MVVCFSRDVSHYTSLVLGYKPPSVKSNDMLNAFNILCDKLLNESQNIVILGDYNYDFLKQNDLSNACVSFDLHNIIKGPTCSMTQRGTLLDLCLVTQPELEIYEIPQPGMLAQ